MLHKEIQCNYRFELTGDIRNSQISSDNTHGRGSASFVSVHIYY